MNPPPTESSCLRRARQFAQRLDLQVPVLLAPMAGACPVSLSMAVAHGGGMGALGALLFDAAQIAHWVAQYRAQTSASLQINLWVPDPPPRRDPQHESRVRDFLGRWGPTVAADAGEAPLRDFQSQCDAIVAARPAAMSSIMGLLPAPLVQRLKRAGIAWFANVTTVAEARAAAAAGADAVVAQGAEAGGHRGAFDAKCAQQRAVGLFALLPQVADAVEVPVIAAGGIGDARAIAAALLLGASAVQIGTGYLRCPEAQLNPAWADALAGLPPEGTMLTRAFSGRWGRAIATEYTLAAAADDAPQPAPYPVQRGLTAALRQQGDQARDLQRMQAWAGQAAAFAAAEPAAARTRRLWSEASALLGH